jgi:hypothetical protein
MFPTPQKRYSPDNNGLKFCVSKKILTLQVYCWPFQFGKALISYITVKGKCDDHYWKPKTDSRRFF